MGITGFTKFVKETWPEAVNETTLQSINIDGRIAVDGNNEAYVYMYTCKMIVIKELSGHDVLKYVSEPEERKELYNRIRVLWLQKIIEFIFTDLKGNVVWVVDGPNVPNLKSEVREERRERVEQSRKKFQEFAENLDKEDLEFQDPSKAREQLIEYMCSTPPKKADYDLLTYVLYRIGVPVVRAWGEGEKTCARLCLDDVPEHLRCKAVWSADVDSILFGAPILIQRVKRSKTQDIESKSMVRFIDSSKLSIKLSDLIDISIAAGCDYYKKGVSRLGLKSAYKYVVKGEPIPVIPETESLNKLFSHGQEEVYEVLNPTPPNEPDMVKDKAKWLISIYHM